MRIVFHQFVMSDVDDVDLFVTEPIYNWQQTEHGRWVMEHAQDIKYYTSADPNTLGYRVVIRVVIRGDIENGPLTTEYFLRWPDKNY